MRRPEILAPAGDRAALEAAVRSGADAVYFGLQGFNARARAANFDAEGLGATLAYLHEHGVKGYVTLNTLVFDDELAAVERAIRACAGAGVDAIIVQDLAVARLAREIAPDLRIHASTQMTCTDASSVEFARESGAARVVVARELSLEDIGAIRAATDVELEVFVHGALCIAYSGQCLTSEAIGGRSANRGACAQACRLPYSLVVDGVPVDTGDAAYLLSPEDLEASALVPALARLGVSSLKIEGRLKGPEYVAATTRLYRAAVRGEAITTATRDEALQTFTRGSGPGFLGGVDHQRLVDGRTCDHRGLEIGQIVDGGDVLLSRDLARGDGILVLGSRAGEGEIGGRVWTMSTGGRDVASASAGQRVKLWLGPETKAHFASGRRVFKTSVPSLGKRIAALPESKRPLDLRIAGAIGEPFVLEGRSGAAFARVTGDAPVEDARTAPVDDLVLKDKLGRLGESPFSLGALENALPVGVSIPLSSLNRARRALVDALTVAVRTDARSTLTVRQTTYVDVLAEATPPSRTPPSKGLFVLCRSLVQAEAAIKAGATGVYLDFLELTGTGEALRKLRGQGAWVGVAPPRVRKPGEEKIDRYLASLEPDALLVRGLGALRETETAANGALHVGDFSLNVTNRITASLVLARGLGAFTPSFDLDGTQLGALLDSPFSAWAEVVVHHPMALFHMEHCAIAALLSEGKDFKTCGRPCETRKVSLRDRAGMDHPVEADVGCRNTVFHARPQSALQWIPGFIDRGVGRFRIELVRERPDEVERLVTLHKTLIANPSVESLREASKRLRTEAGIGVVKGSLRVLS